MKVLELFSGTGSVGKVCKDLGYEVISLDLKNANINCNILDWDYTSYTPNYFDIIWASPPCDTFSNLRKSWIGRKLKVHKGEVCTMELLQKDINEIGLPILRKTEEIINYFKPNLWFIENPKTGQMKDYLKHLPYYDVDYCKYTDWGYRKPTRIWTNKVGFIPKTCNKDCVNIINGRHICCLGHAGDKNTKNDKYRIPPILVNELLV
jgi:hypothetical protein